MLDFPRAFLRGRYMKAAAKIEHIGTPIDVDAFSKLQQHWSQIQKELINAIDQDYQVYDGTTFKRDLFEKWVTQNGIPWPRLRSGELSLRDETFRQMAKTHSGVAPLRELRVALSQMRLSNLAVGHDGRNRCMLSAFQARTGRNQPSTKKSIFGPSVWVRGLIRPEPGYGLAYIDWAQQEFGIAAALSGDEAMKEAYRSGAPFLAFAKQVGAVPQDATKETHRFEREKFKACVLAVQYGMGAASLSQRIGRSEAEAKELLRKHRETYPAFWSWSEAVLDHGLLTKKLWTAFGWTIHVGGKVNRRFLQNFPMQANGAEMLRLACCFATERGVQVCAPIHDAILIEAPLEGLEDAVQEAQNAMADASNLVLDGFTLRTDEYLIRHPDRYEDPRGIEMWNTVWTIIDSPEGKTPVAPRNT